MPDSALPFSERIKDTLTVALGIYPLFVGIYAAGLFWDLPKDAIGGFSFGDIVFKASIVYTSIAAVLISYTLTTSALYFFIPEKRRFEMPDSGTTESVYHPQWNSLDRAEKIRVSLATLSLFSVMSFAIYTDPPKVGIEPYSFAGLLMFVFLLGLPSRYFVKYRNWKAASILYAMSWAIVGPLALGYGDSQPDQNSPLISFKGFQCRVVFIGEKSLLGDCPNQYVLLQRTDSKSRIFWSKRVTRPTE